MKQKEQREEYLLDMLEYYTPDPKKRRAVVEGVCSYAPTKTSEGCAIGRRCSPEIVDLLQTNNFPVNFLSIFDELPDWMKKLDQNFLIDMQLLHDRHSHWTKKGLSKKGKKKLIAIINKFELDKTKFEKWTS